ncbi:hypothetical protein AB205_0172560, partial [Aquarana catesbeiana]
LAGGTLLGVGIWVSVDSNSFLKIFGTLGSGTDSIASQFVNVGYFLIAIGALLVILGFLGCCGAQKESKCLLIMAESFLTSVLTPVLKNEYGSNQAVTSSWNNTMNDLKCCGLTNYTDFNNSYYVKQNNGNYPPLCCNSTTTPCTQSAAAISGIN